jgi:dUTP pyrophosphatase
MKNVELKIKRLHPEAVIPSFAKHGDAGMDLTAVSQSVDADSNFVYHIGLAVEIPEGYVGLLFPRSSNSKKDLLLSNSVGVIDSGYRGELMLKFKYINANHPKHYGVGERVAQLVIMKLPFIDVVEVDELSSSERGEGGFGSTGK